MGFTAEMLKLKQIGIASIFAIIAAGFLSGLGIYCIFPEEHRDRKLAGYIDEFVAEGKKYGVEVNADYLAVLEFDDEIDLDEHIGYCIYSPIPIPKTNIVRVYRPVEFNYYFKALIFHELAHCILFKDHDPPGSTTIMSP